MSKVGIQIGATTSPGDLPGVARTAEEVGYSEIWLAEDYFQLGGVAAAATVLAATAAIPVGLGVVSAAVRHPAVTAMEFATVGGAHPGRFMGGLGHGSPVWVRQMGLAPASSMGLLREATVAIRKLLDGETVTSNGDYFSLDEVSLDHTPAVHLPLYYGVHGPASLRMAGELVEGTLLGWFSSPDSVAWARQRIDEGSERRGRQDPHEVVTLCLLSVSPDDPDGAGRNLARWAASMLAAMADSAAMKLSPAGQELGRLVARVGKEGLGDAIPHELLGQFAAVGSVEDCAATVQALLDAGSDRVVLVPNPAGFRTTTEMIEQIKLAGALA